MEHVLTDMACVNEPIDTVRFVVITRIVDEDLNAATPELYNRLRLRS